jgi:hypothetical protein
MSRSNTRAITASTSSCGALPACHPHTRVPRLILVASYFVRVTITKRMADVVKEKDIWVHSYRMPPDSNNAIKMEVGIEDCLHIEFEYNKSKWALGSRPLCGSGHDG